MLDWTHMTMRAGTAQHGTAERYAEIFNELRRKWKMAWSDRETFKLIEIWGDEIIQEQLEGCKKNREVYEKIAKLMCEEGYDRTWTQCRDKIKKLKVDYRKVRDKNKETGNKRRDNKFYKAMNEVMADKPTTQPPVLIDTSTDEPADITSVLEEDESNCYSPYTDSGAITEESSRIGSDTNSQKDDSSAGLANQEATSSADEIKPLAGLKRKRNTKLDKVEKAMEKVCDKMTKGQADSDKLFIDLEEKRMKLDYEMLKMEQEWRKEEAERAERQRREERDFQLRVFQMMYSQGNNTFYPNPQYYPGNMDPPT